MLHYIHDRITVDPDLCNGQLTIRGHRLTLQTILEFLAAGDEPTAILEDYDFLELADIQACQQLALKMALETLNHPVHLPARESAQ